MSLMDIELKNIYRNSTNQILDDLVKPLLTQSKVYYRGVGFFTSNWIKLVTNEIKVLVDNGGKICLITSPKLSKEDWDAISIGNKAKIDNVLYESIKKSIEYEFDIESKYECLNLFSWLIADGILELKFAICNNNKGMYHDKIAIFEDEQNNRVCLHGSFNDSLQATYNGESMSVFRSWNRGQSDYVNDHLEEFMSMWNHKNNFYKVFDTPEKVKKEFQKYKSNKRPYTAIKDTEIHLPKFIDKLNGYQEEAIQSIINNGWSGILEMATGTGKTITSLAASKKYFEENKRIFLVVIVPFNHLVTQWEENILQFGYKIPIKCNENQNKWITNLMRKIRNYNSGISHIESAVTTYTTFSSDKFQLALKKVKGNIVLIADECHYAGSKAIRSKFLENIDVKIGLSATPQRWFDEEGSEYVQNYFCGTSYVYDMEDAIKNGFLTEYYYTPEVIRLNNNEYELYKNLTSKIIKLLQLGEKVEPESNLQNLILKRAEIISKAENKLQVFLNRIKEQFENGKINNTLVYCAKGESKKITKYLSNMGISVHEFTYDVSNSKRKKILDSFAQGEIQVLVAIKCLDEGVDVPSTQTAYFLSSTSNPREFIQRRGRILRKYKNKHKSSIIDYIVLPPEDSANIQMDRSIIEKDMPRFAEFAKYSFNEFEAKNKMRRYLEVYNLEYLMEKLPWELYTDRKEKFEYE